MTLGPAGNTGVVQTGIAAHIHAASSRGGRYEPAQTSEQRRSAENGIWLCDLHGRLIDADADHYRADKLRCWKAGHEQEIREAMGGPPQPNRGPAAATTGRSGRLALGVSLPIPLTSFVGREQDLEDLTSVVQSSRLVTLTGPPGTGKSRLGLEAARRLVDAFPDGVVLVSMGSIVASELVMPTIAAAIGVRELPGHPLEETVREAIGDARILLLLDNVDHLVAAAPTIKAALVRCPHLTVLATSTSAFSLAGEREVRIMPLPVPSAVESADLGRAVNSPALALFVDRARDAVPSFRLTEQNVRDVAGIVGRLDGLPLAIELAAAWTRTLGPKTILSRLASLPERAFADGGSEDPLLRAAIRRSYDRLASDAQTLFRRLGAFRGSASLAALEAIALGRSAGLLPMAGVGVLVSLPGDALAAVRTLVESSLVLRSEEHDGAPRYRVLESIRDFAVARLRRSGEYALALSAHAAIFIALAEAAEPHLATADERAWLARLESDHDNLRAALDWLHESGDRDAACRLGGALWRFWYVHGHLAEGRAQVNRLLRLGRSRTALSPAVAKLLLGSGVLAREQSDFAKARRDLGAAIRFYRKVGLQSELARALYHLGILEGRDGRHTTARRLHEESHARAREIRDDWAIASAARGLSHEHVAQRDYSAARKTLRESLSYFRRTGDQRGLAISLRFAGDLSIDLGEHPAARAYLREALSILPQFDDRWSVNNALLALARLAATEGHPKRALKLEGAASALRSSIGALLSDEDRTKVERWLAPARRVLSSEERDAVFEEGRKMPFDEVLAYAFSDEAE